MLKSARSRADDLDAYLHSKGSPLAGQGQTLVKYGNRYGVDPRLLVALAGAETSFGTDPNAGQDPAHFNVWGWGPHIKFRSWDDAIGTITRGLKKNYIDKGLNTIAKIGNTWAPPSENNTGQWAQNVAGFFHELGGADKLDATAIQTAANEKAAATPLQSFGPTPTLAPLTLSPTTASSTDDPSTLQNVLESNAEIAAGSFDPANQLASTVSSLLTAPETPPPQAETSLSPLGELPTLEPLQPDTQTSDTQTGDTQIGDPVPPDVQTSIGPEHETSGLPGFPAHDYMAPAGSPVVAPADGEIVRFSGHSPAHGPTEGIHGPFGWSLYLQGQNGRMYYMTHLGSRGVRVGQKVRAGEPIATIGDYARWGGADHVHMGVSSGG